MCERKETDIGLIPDTWEIKTIDEIKSDEKKSIISGPFGSNISAKYFVNKGVPVIRGNNLSLDINKKFNDSGFVFITEDKANELGTWALKDDIVFTAVGTIGQVGILRGNENFNKYIISNKQLRLRINKQIVEPLYAYYWFASPLIIDMILQRNTGSSVPLINLSVLKSLLIPLPPKIERIQILNILSSLDDKIDLLHRQNQTLEKMAETLFKQWFVEEAKEDWEEKSLGQLFTITSSKRIFYSEYVSSGVPFYRSKEIIELRSTGSTASELYISNERFDEINSRFGSPKEGDILMTSVGTLGVAYRVKASDKFYFKDGNLTWFKDFKELPSSIIYLWLISKIGQEELASITIGSTQQALTIEGLKSISFKIPPKESISEYEKEFDGIISKIELNQTQIRTLSTLRDTLLPKLMSGEVRVEM
jgi:type I restriction enzyme, S subunit